MLRLSLIDLFLKPLKLWARAIQNLPARLWVADTAVSGLAAAVLSLLVIGGIPYDRLWDWGFKEPPKQDLMGAVMDRVQKLDNGEGSDDLEESIGDFAGKEGDEPIEKPKADPPKPKQKADCVILGYVSSIATGALATLVLGTANGGQLVYAGNVTPKLSGRRNEKVLSHRSKRSRANGRVIRIEYRSDLGAAKVRVPGRTSANERKAGDFAISSGTSCWGALRSVDGGKSRTTALRCEPPGLSRRG